MMVRLRTLRALGALDAGSALADPLLRWMAAVPLLVALAVRLLLPLVVLRLGVLAERDLHWLLAPMAGYAVAGIAPLIAGAAVGFLLLDQRDDRTLLALRVTPLPLGAYLAYRLAAPTLVALPVTFVALALADAPGLGLMGTLLVVLAAAPLAPLAAVSLLALARNKLEGMALTKAASLLLAAPLAALFLPPPWSLAPAIAPTYWAARVTWALQAGANPWPFVVGAWLIPALVIGVLLWRLRRTLGGG
jgi:fluoroquinolone transport system permease protein